MMEEGNKGPRQKVSDGIKQGIGVLSAFKDALEETIEEARERGDLSTDRAKDVMKRALEKAQGAAEGARDRLDFVHQKEFDGLRDAMGKLRTRVSALEERVFGAPGSRADSASTGEPSEVQEKGGGPGRKSRKAR